jgi:hypothetical protein
LTAKESECKASLDVVVAVDGRPNGGDDAFANTFILKYNRLG